MKCGKEGCRYQAKIYGVCGHHKSLAFQYDTKSFQAHMKNYNDVMKEYKKETDRLEEEGINILDIQACFENGLTNGKTKEYPPHFKKMGELLENQLKMIEELQEIYDPYLVSNVTSRISHKVLTENCSCLLCSLKN